MTSSTFCPVCQRKNKLETKRCAYCGSVLRMEKSGIDIHTTLNISPSLDNFQSMSHCRDYLKQISQEDIFFILEKKQTPVILHDVSEVILGRFIDDERGPNLDLDPYGGGAFGVSRRHARIMSVNNNFVFEDLNSTNGSWLNGQRIPADTPYPLMSGDQIWLGQFKLQVCFHQTDIISQSTIFLRDTTAVSSKILTPDRLVTQIGYYLKTISDLQDMAVQCLQLEAKEVVIEKIDASGSDSYIVVHIVNISEAVHLVRKWIIPWRQEQYIKEDKPTEANETKQALVQLTTKLIADIAPNLESEARFAMIEKNLPLVTELATGSIELSFEAL